MQWAGTMSKNMRWWREKWNDFSCSTINIQTYIMFILSSIFEFSRKTFFLFKREVYLYIMHFSQSRHRTAEYGHEVNCWRCMNECKDDWHAKVNEKQWRSRAEEKSGMRGGGLCLGRKYGCAGKIKQPSSQPTNRKCHMQICVRVFVWNT